MLFAVVADARQALRALRARPGFSLSAVAMLALATGITTAMFSVFDALIWRPLPFAHPEQLAAVWMRNQTGGLISVDPAVLRAWRQTPAFSAVESAVEDAAVVDIDGTLTMRGVARVTPGLFPMLGEVRPIRGRVFDPGEGRAGSDARVLLSETTWRSLYGGDEAIIGRQVRVNGEPLTVIGILPADLRFPSAKVELWRAVDYDQPSARRATERAMAYVRFAPSMPREDALRMATNAAHEADASTKALYAEERDILRGDLYNARAIQLLAGGVVLVFVVLCVNVASLFLLRLTAARREFSLRAALGASRRRLLREAVVEGGVLAVAGGVAGAVLAVALLSMTRAFLPDAFLQATLNTLDLDRRALVVSSAAGAIAAMLTGLLPAWLATRVDGGEALRVDPRNSSEPQAGRWLARAFLVGQVAFACMLMAGATLLVRSFVNLNAVERGLQTERTLTAWFSWPTAVFPDRPAQAAAARAIEEAIEALAGVERVVWSDGLPPNGGGFSTGSWISDGLPAPTASLRVGFFYVDSDFFSLYGIPLLRGRMFGAGEAEHSVIVGERWAQTLWPGRDPIGRTFRRAPNPGQGGTPQSAPTYEVVGVVRELTFPSVNGSLDMPEFYHPASGPRPPGMLSIRCGGSCPSVAMVRDRVAAASPGVRINSVEAADARYLEQLERPRATAALAFAFAALALLASAGGLFSALSYAVTRRKKEFGIRSAIGASPRQLRVAIMKDALLVTGAGLVLGMAGAMSLAQVLASLQYGVAPNDPVSWLLVWSALVLSALIAAWRPAREAGRADAILFLRGE